MSIRRRPAENNGVTMGSLEPPRVRPTETVFDFPATGEHFVLTSHVSDSSRLTFEFRVDPGGGVPQNHRHCGQRELMHCISGELDVTVDGTPTTLRPGDTIELEAGTLHKLVNRGADEAYCRVEYQPAGRNREWFQLIAAAQFRTGRDPGLLDIAPFITDVDILLGGPAAPQRFVLRRLIGPIATLLGRRRKMLAIATDVYGREFTW
jgi:quercetin dioxygenase-like cupin family protein